MRYPIVAAAVAALILSSFSTAFAQAPQPQTTTRPPSAPSTSAAQPSQGAPTYSSENTARASCRDQVVWMNTDPASHIYHFSGSKDYGHTKNGAYMCKADADKIGRAAKNEKDPGAQQTMPAPGTPPKPTSR